MSSSPEPKETRKEERARKRREELEKDLDEDSDPTLSEDSSDEKDSGSRKISLSPTQYLASFATGALGGSKPARQSSMERPSARSSAMQALGAKLKETSCNVPVEAVACVVELGVDTIQLGNQGHPRGHHHGQLQVQSAR